MSAPARPPAWEEYLASRLFRALAPRFAPLPQPEPPLVLGRYSRETIARRRGRGTLSGIWYPASKARGAVLLVHPWLVWGQSYFHRRRRIQVLRDAGYDVMTFDLPGFGESGPASGFYDLDVEDALAHLSSRSSGVPLFLWGVSSGGYWAHPVLSRSTDVAAAMFEDVSPHLLEWSSRTAPAGRPCYAFFRRAFPRAYRFLDLRRHAPYLRVRSVSYVGGGDDDGILPDETLQLARLAGGRGRVVPGAPHLAAIKKARAEVHALALETFERSTVSRVLQPGEPAESTRPVDRCERRLQASFA